MGKIPDHLRETIARNIRNCRLKNFPGRGGGKKCAEKFGVSPQQWSPWESGKRTPDELRLEQIARFFAVTVEWLRKDHRNEQPPPDTVPGYLQPKQKPQNYQSSTNPDFLYDIMNKLMELHKRCVHQLHKEYGNGQQTNAGDASEQLASTGEPSYSTAPVASESP